MILINFQNWYVFAYKLAFVILENKFLSTNSGVFLWISLYSLFDWTRLAIEGSMMKTLICNLRGLISAQCESSFSISESHFRPPCKISFFNYGYSFSELSWCNITKYSSLLKISQSYKNLDLLHTKWWIPLKLSITCSLKHEIVELNY